MVAIGTSLIKVENNIMKNLAIQAENISKQYRLGEVGTGTLSHDLNRLWHKIRGNEDPYLKLGDSNDRSSKGTSDYVWSLRDINFEIEQGDSVGIIGRNGAGKSTLLKLLSKVTKPTTGSFKVNGRIASLLEVGTGFNPEMTGRENIYLNGAILGMRRQEITRKLDEIIEFSGVERYIDTPVKRYSSGMYVRLAFAVAAHLESEILIVDEVLAVGDAEFQKKCLGKMGDVSKYEGRTVLFVSHNMNAVKSLCNSGIVLEKGNICYSGKAESAVNLHLNNDSFKSTSIKNLIKWQNPDIEIEQITINGSEKNHLSVSNTNNSITVEIQGHTKTENILTLELDVYDMSQNKVAFFGPGMVKGLLPKYSAGSFKIKETFNFPKNMAGGTYVFDINLSHPYVQYHLNAPGSFLLEYTGYPFVSGENDYGNRGYIIID